MGDAVLPQGRVKSDQLVIDPGPVAAVEVPDMGRQPLRAFLRITLHGATGETRVLNLPESGAIDFSSVTLPQ